MGILGLLLYTALLPGLVAFLSPVLGSYLAEITGAEYGIGFTIKLLPLAIWALKWSIAAELDCWICGEGELT